MKIKIRDKNGNETVIDDAKVLKVSDKTGKEFRITEDNFNGIEVLAEHDSYLYVKPGYGNQVTLIASDRV
jgi:hypothetical protein